MNYGNRGSVGCAQHSELDTPSTGGVSKQGSILTAQLSHTERALSELEDRLGAVLRPVPPTDDADKAGEIYPSRCSLADALDNLAGRLCCVSRRIEGLIGRIDL